MNDLAPEAQAALRHTFYNRVVGQLQQMKQQIQSPAAAVLLLNGRGELEVEPEKDGGLGGTK